MIKILLATDSFNQVNGVSTTYKNILNVTKRSVKVIHPGMFKINLLNCTLRLKYVTNH